MTQIVHGEKHFTASVWIITKTKPRKVLLIHHKKFDKWLQPGGHIEKFENPVEAAIREVKEETGVDISSLAEEIIKLNKEGAFLPVPRFLMEQILPENPKEPRHFHLDIQYVIEISQQEVQHNLYESYGIGWFTKEEARKLNTYPDAIMIIEKLL
jgi:8-oxo-dGTP pyrophosphatase MutT (NUDIX family)